MNLSTEVKLEILEANLQALIREEYSILTALSIAVEVGNEPLVQKLQPRAETSRKTINAFKKKIAEVMDEAKPKPEKENVPNESH